MDKSLRYKQLDELFRYEEGYTINDLLVRLEDNISKRTLLRDISVFKRGQ